MNDNYQKNIEPQLGLGSGLSLKKEGPQVSGQKKCPHCERMIDEDAKICTECGYDLVHGKTAQELARGGKFPIKTIFTLAAVAALGYVGYMYKDTIIDAGKQAIEENTDIDLRSDDEKAAQKAELPDPYGFADKNFEQLEETKYELEGEREEVAGQYETDKEDLDQLKEEISQYQEEYDAAEKKVKKSKDTAIKAKKRSKQGKMSRDKVAEYIDVYKTNVEEFKDIKAEMTKLKVELKEIEAKLGPQKAVIEELDKKLKSLKTFEDLLDEE